MRGRKEQKEVGIADEKKNKYIQKTRKQGGVLGCLQGCSRYTLKVTRYTYSYFSKIVTRYSY